MKKDLQYVVHAGLNEGMNFNIPEFDLSCLCRMVRYWNYLYIV